MSRLELMKDDWLKGDLVEARASSKNHGGKFSSDRPDTIVIHYTAGSSAASAIRALQNENRKVSAHLVVGRDGSVTQLVPFDTIAWHAGKSSFVDKDGGERGGLNQYSIGIEIDNAGQLKKNGDKFQSWFGKSYTGDEVFEGVHRNQSLVTYWHNYTEAQIGGRPSDIFIDLKTGIL